MPKYSVPEDHWKEDDEPDPEPEPRVSVNYHSIVIDEKVDREYIVKIRWHFGFEGRSLKGWTRTDIEENGTEDYANDLDWERIPADVKRTLANEVGLTVSELAERRDLPDFLEGCGAE